ncbi:hypothetical protein SAMN04487944_117106 [Gracilibacillus ureilyticus]|uniref:Uncharacterized protein n=1 Tax=Gracilibacillus ureilyticus TaxID=531814 RepID=A0A1H9UH63_9BACI|nr:hypothetical protein [Gracilibacillus ureilyticus]SES08775.1 hypothetical protein SAMN04487944_117106 [Gracilibacillus ureilyticus]
MDRIYFVDNPWPNGHRITSFHWEAHFKYEAADEKRNGLYFDLHIETADYYEEDIDDEDDEDEDDDGGDWQAKIVWNNYHRCTLSSQEWDNKGFLVESEHSPFDLTALDGKEYAVDFLTQKELENPDLNKTAFDVYLLGHDASAFHSIHFTKIEGECYRIDWKGKLAQAYVGDYEFKYDFHTTISSAVFNGIYIPKEISDKQAYEFLERFVQMPELFEMNWRNRERRFMIK